MSKYLSTLYSSAFKFLSASNFPMKVRGFSDLGSRIINLTNMVNHGTDLDEIPLRMYPLLFLHDQEPIMFTQQLEQYLKLYLIECKIDARNIILTSEQHSPQLDFFCKCFGSIPCHWFSNAALSIEWYADDDFRLPFNANPNLKFKFSCLNRLISNQRQYRPVIAAHLLDTVDHDKLQLSCSMIDPNDNRCHASRLHDSLPSRHKQLVSRFAGAKQPLELNISFNDIVDRKIKNTSYSLNYQYFDETFCHIVTETLFYGSTLHLTEKSLRPIVNQRPFILAGPPRSLDYLRRYGFRTFHDFWDESYDHIYDANLRLDAILKLISDINMWPLSKMQKTLSEMSEILQHNRYVFHNKLADSVKEELINNLTSAIWRCRTQPNQGWHIRALDAMTDEEYNESVLGMIPDDGSNPFQAALSYDSRQLRNRAAGGINQLMRLDIKMEDDRHAMASALRSLINR